MTPVSARHLARFAWKTATWGCRAASGVEDRPGLGQGLQCALNVAKLALQIADLELASGHVALEFVILGLNEGKSFPGVLCRTERLDRLARRANFLGDFSHPEVCICELSTQQRIVVALTDEPLVILESLPEQFLAEIPGVDRVLELEQRTFADAGQMVFHGLLSHDKVGLGLLAGDFLAPPASLDDDDGHGGGQGDTDQGGSGAEGPGAVMAQPAPSRSKPCSE